ncbi:PDZ domain (Also known as DHR or GLGF) domain-containing protein [Phthorimaea operculella]|nr:PDZ domain (Also known as DHR or GLGF) domain-containing protein [Phthorimaea operculella]
MLETRKLPRRSMSVHDRHSKSDAEDKSLSNDEIPLPTCPRQPPDGVETPSDAVEKIPEPPSRLPPRLPAGWPNTRTRLSYTSRLQDARSEASVKDKIAMFSNDRSTSTDHLDKCGTLPIKTSSNTRKSSATYTTNYAEISSLDRRLTKSQDNLDEVPRSYKRHMDRPEVLGALENATPNSKSTSVTHRPLQESKPLFYGSTTTLPSSKDKTFAQPVYHTRSSSDDNGNENTHKSNLEYLIEQRKKSMSKLRGLVIPEVQGPVVDLPEIKVQDSLAKSFLLKPNQNNNKINEYKTTTSKPSVLNDSKWKNNLLPNNLPKYSPAFKRKSLQVYTPTSLSKESTPERKFNEKVEMLSKVQKNKPLMGSLDYKNVSTRTATLPSKFPISVSGKFNDKEFKDILSDYKNVEIKICTATDIVDSDNDSAMSSTQSSYRSSASSPMHTIDTIESDSSRLSPRISHYTTYSLVKTEMPTKTSAVEKSCEEYMKRNVCRSVSSDTNVSFSSSAGSAATSGSQASCSSLESSVADSDKRKVSKTYNIDTINRRNILASAKCRSGRDEKLNSPVFETKFSHESYDRSPSPTPKASDRLSTLTSSVSAVTNKGDSRRRSKVIAETDSDSDSDVNVRQRKTDFKNTRLKRNSSSARNKQNEVSSESPKAEDAPRVISEKIMKEIKKAGLDNYSSIKSPATKKESIIPIAKNTTVVENNTLKITQPSKSKIESADKTDSSSAEESKVPTYTFHLKKGAGSGVGLILAGGIDCEAKDVTVHRVLADSAAAKAGLKRGAKVRSINGFTMTGLTHAQSVTILKEQRSEVVIEIEKEIRENANGVGCGSENAESKVRHGVIDSGSGDNKASGSVVTVVLEKAGGGAGLGFGLDGGRDSPQGDRPLTIKKLFAGGAAAQSGRVLVGAELLSAGGQSMEGFTRTQAWAALKALPAGPVALVLRNPRDQVAP